MEIQKRRPLIILTGVCALGLALSGCGSKGIYTPYTEGSTLAQGKPEEAVFSVSYDAPNELFHQPRYDITLAVKDTDKTITLGFIMDGDFQSPANDTVQLTAR
ncbi:MAG: hypothetical protein HY074_00040, partial [Deltaproteobacteria bacterium]|nr:hypothetical protein [Deltaproteobacteria bacterium]